MRALFCLFFCLPMMNRSMMMMICCCRRRAFFAVVLHLVLGSISAVIALPQSPINDSKVNVPTFSLDDLLHGRRLNDLKTVLTTTGLLAVVLPEDEHEQDDDLAALQGLCQCANDNTENFLSMDGTDTIILSDDIPTTTTTTRITLATATVGTTPLPLPDSLALHCGLDTAKSMETLRDQVAIVSNAFIHALDRLLEESSSPHGSPPQQQQRPLLRNWDGGSYSSIASIRNGANHLEHFHVYNKQVSEEDKDFIMIDEDNYKEQHESTTLRWHTDAGLFLAFVPAINCNEKSSSSHQERDTSFWFMDNNNVPIQAIFPTSRSIAIMLGVGAEHWIDTTNIALKATKHAVKMQNGDVRAWYGMMHLVPDRAIVQSSPIRRTFADMKRAMTLSADSKARTFGDYEEQAPSIGCGFSTEEDAGNKPPLMLLDVVSSPNRRRRLQHVASPGECNNVTNFFCWMQCLEIPNHEQARGYVNEGYSLYCLDPATLASTGNRVSSAAEPCQAGWVHNAACQGSWQPTAPGVTAYPVNVEAQEEDAVPESFCYGGTSMYMDGFHWLHPTCVIYLFPKWVLSTPGKLAAATIGTLFSGMALEKIIQQRRLVVSSMDPGYKRLSVSSIFYGFQLTLGYFIMLVVMTYSGPLFLAVVLGLVGGHVLFNATDALFPGVKAAASSSQHSTNERDGEKINGNDSGEEEDDKGGEETDKAANCSENGKLPDNNCCEKKSCGTTTSKVHVPEGITPCCLNTL